MEKSFFFYDLETSGLNPREDRIMQFAGQRTTMDLEPVGEPVNILVKMTDEVLPSPAAIMVTKITPQATLRDGIFEAEFCKKVSEDIFTPGTIAVGYNNVRFDDEFMRATFWRNFYEPYEWEWKDERSRWDILDVVRMTRALRPDGIKWPFKENGHATNSLEDLTSINGILHEHAHDALSDVYATIAVAQLIREKQPKLFNYLMKSRGKNEAKQLVNLDFKKPFVYTSGKYASEFNKTTVAFPLTSGRNGNVLVFDLRYNLEEILEREPKEDDSEPVSKSYYPIVKELCFNKCPAVAPIGVLDEGDSWERIGLSRETVDKNLEILLKHPEFAEEMRSFYENRPEFPPALEPEVALYDGFLDDLDRKKVTEVRDAGAEKLADFHPEFHDERLPELLLHYKGRNYPEALSEDETVKWQEYRRTRLERITPKFLSELEQNYERDEYIGEELKLYFESLFQ